MDRVKEFPLRRVSVGISPSKSQLYSVAPGLEGVNTNSGTQISGCSILKPAVSLGCTLMVLVSLSTHP